MVLDSNTTVNNIHNNAENTYGIVEYLYQDNKEYAEKIINQLEKDKEVLQKENAKLLGIIEKNNYKIKQKTLPKDKVLIFISII